MTRALRLIATLLTFACLARAQGPTGPTDPRLAPVDELMTAFLREHHVPGGALAIAKGDRLVYARGFGLADLERAEPVQPESLFRIASVSKPLTSAAVMQLVDQGKLSLDAHALELLGVPASGDHPDPRWGSITIRDLLTHAGGFDRGKSGDPMFMARQIASDLKTSSPPAPSDIIRWMASRPLDFDPGTKSVYSNFGYSVLGRAVEHASGQGYEAYVREHILLPLGITRMRIGSTLESGRAQGEVRYYSAEPAGPSIFDRAAGEVASPYGLWCLESMDSHGGWIASAPDLVRFAVAVGQPGRVVSASALETMWGRPAYAKAGADAYYACGWSCRRAGERVTVWHGGSLPGTGTLLVRRADGFTWAVLFNTREGNPAGAIDPLVHRAVDAVKEWPEGQPLFSAGSAARSASEDR